MVAEEFSEEIPDTILFEFTHRVIQDGREIFKVSGKRGEFFEEKRQALFYGVAFQEFDADGILITRGVCNNARIYTDTENAELWGELDFYSSKDEASLKGNSLFWDDAASVLSGSDEEIIEIQKDSNKTVAGRGFYVDLNTRVVSFQGDITGSWVEDEE